jgi:hypothetical protein
MKGNIAVCKDCPLSGATVLDCMACMKWRD